MANDTEYLHVLICRLCMSSLCLLLIGFFFFTVEVGEFFIYSRYKDVVRHMIFEYFISVCNFSFHSLNSCKTKVNFSDHVFDVLKPEAHHLWTIFDSSSLSSSFLHS